MEEGEMSIRADRTRGSARRDATVSDGSAETAADVAAGARCKRARRPDDMAWHHYSTALLARKQRASYLEES
jgi:hypothetical protein